MKRGKDKKLAKKNNLLKCLIEFLFKTNEDLIYIWLPR